MSVEIDFTGYPANLSDATDWVENKGSFVITSGEVYSDVNSVVSMASYVGHAFNADHVSEVTFGTSTGGSATAQGCAVRVQTGAASGYFIFVESSATANVYLGIMNAGSESYPLSGSIAGQTGDKLRLEVTGTGSATRLTAKYNDSGAGWVTIGGMGSYDPGTYFDGGSPGICGYNDNLIQRITGVHFEGEIPNGIDVDFAGYSDGNLDSHADWVVQHGSMNVDGGQVYNTGAEFGLARYIGHSFNADQVAEVLVGESLEIADNFFGCAVRLQSGSDSGYFVGFNTGTSGEVLLGSMDGGSENIFGGGTAPSTISAPGSRVRLEVTGTGSAVRLTVKYNIGAGWVTVTGLESFDPTSFGPEYDSGAPGILGYGDSLSVGIAEFHAEGQLDTNPIVGSTSLSFTDAGTLTGGIPAVGTSSLTFTDAGTLTGNSAGVGSTSLTFAMSGLLTGATPAVGSSSLTFTDAGTLTGNASASAASSVSFTLTGVMALGGIVGGTSLVFAPITGVLSGIVTGVGSSSVTFIDTGTLLGLVLRSGTSALTFTTTGLVVNHRMVGSSSVTFAPSGFLIDRSTGPVIGTTSLTFIPATTTAYAPVGRPFLFTQVNWRTEGFYFEVEMRASSGAVRAELRDDESGVPVDRSQLETSDTAFTRLRSSKLLLTDGRTYRASIGRNGLDRGQYRGLTLISK